MQADWVTQLSSGAALITALTALLTVLEIRRQRRTMYCPDFALAQTNIFAYRDSRGRVRLSCSAEPPSSHLFLLDHPHPWLLGANVGLGVAKDVQPNWVYDALEFVRVLKTLDAHDDFEIECDSTALHIKGSKFGWLGDTICTGADTIAFPYVVPVSVSDTPVHLELPCLYLAQEWKVGPEYHPQESAKIRG